MKIMFIGLGLIGGSMALALNGYPDTELYAVENNEFSRFEALNRSAVKAAWRSCDDAPLERMDVTVICLHPHEAVDFITKYAPRLKPGSLLTDVCGLKKLLYEAVNALPERQFVFLGGHPMAGREKGGFANATPDLFRGSHFILTPDETVPEEAIRLMRLLTAHMGCADIITTSPEKHDQLIAYTSQLMHVMALAICDSPLLDESYGLEGNSFRGATRVAALDPVLWTDLFHTNRDALADVTDELSDLLHEYSALLRSGDEEALLARLRTSSDRKRAFNAKCEAHTV